MDPGWDHTENEDKLLLAHTLGMGRDMGTNMDITWVNTSSGGCSNDNTSSDYGLTSLSGEYNRHISNISGNILNANQNSLSTLSISYISYFYLYYQKLIKVFPNILYLNYLRFVYILNKYINCSLTRFKSIINYLSCISTSLTSSKSKIQSLTVLIPQFEGLINNVFCKLKSAIRLNITCLCLHITPVWKIFISCNKEIRHALKIICCINKLVHTKCNIGIVVCFQQCLNQIKCKLKDLYSELHKLYSSYWYINCLKNESQNIIKCNKDITTLKPKICELAKRYKCSICEFPKIESLINCIKTKIPEITQLKQKLCKIFDQVYLLICVCSSNGNSIEILIINVDSIKKNIKCLTGKIEKICSEFKKIENNTPVLKHSLAFNWYYFQISSYILNELQCIQSNTESIKSKTDDLDAVSSHITVISGNIRELRSVVEKMNENRDDLGYVRDSLFSIIPKICEIKESANTITTKSTQIQCVVESLNKIKSSIQNLKNLEHDNVCLEIFDFTDKCILIRTLVCIRDKLNIRSITAKLVIVNKSICGLESVISNSKKLETCMESLLNKMNYIVQWIDEVEKCLDNVIKRFIQCSLQSLLTHLTSLNSRISDRSNIRDAEVDNPVMSIYSLMSVMDYGVVVNRLYELSKKIDQILQLIPWPDGCRCILGLERSNKIDLGTMNVKKIMEEMTKKNNNQNDSLKLDKIRTLIQNDIKDNHVCLCMVFKYILYPSIINLLDIMVVDIETLSTISRKFSKYRLTIDFKVNLSQFFIMCVELLYKLSNYILLKYKYSWEASSGRVNIKCFCCYYQDRNYYGVVSTILVLSSLMENIWAMDIETLRMTIQYLSSLIREFDMIDSYNNSKNSYRFNIFKLSFVSALSSSTQSCKMLAKLRIIIDLVSLSTKVTVLESFVRRYIYKISLCNIFHFDKVLHNFHNGINNGTNGVKDYIGWVLKLYKSLNSPCNGCNKSNCCCNICVNLIILWVSIYIWLKVNIKLHESKTRYKERLTNLLTSICNNDNDCCCKDLQTVCDELCCKGCAGCVCKTLKDNCKAICGDGSNCVCKLIKECLQDLCTKKGMCDCKNKGGCCRCVCWKIVGMSIKILTRACRANVVEAYKRITIELLNSTKNKRELLQSILDSISDSMVNKLKMVKNLYSIYPQSVGSYPSKIDGVTNVETRNWGYDTKYEHDVTNDRGFRRGDQYPHVSHRIRTGDSNGMSGNKAFKMILSKLLITS